MIRRSMRGCCSVSGDTFALLKLGDMDKRYFTIEEANAIVPDLLEIVPKLQALHAKLSDAFPDVRNAWEKARYGGGSVQGADYLAVALAANQLTNALESKGCVLKGIERGLVDFPAMRDGKEVFLCWKNPETEIRYWHDLDTGFAGRQPL